MKLSTPGILGLLASTRPQFATIITRTPVELLKGGRAGRPVCPYPQGSIFRLAERQGMIGVKYDNVVNRQRDREQTPLDDDGDVEQFYAEKLWNGAGERVNACIVKHRLSGQRYLVFYPKVDLLGDPVIKQQRYETAEGKRIERSAFEPWIKKSSGGSKRQGTEKQINWRLIKIEHLVQLRFGGKLIEAA